MTAGTSSAFLLPRLLSQWIIIDANVYDISRFKRFHPGGLSVLLDPDIGKGEAHPYISLVLRIHHYLTAGQDATDSFYSLHRHEVLEQSQYKRLKVGTIAGEQSVIRWRVPGSISKVPYAEPTWLSDGYHSPYFSDVSGHPIFLVVFMLMHAWVIFVRTTARSRKRFASFLIRSCTQMLL